MEFKPYQFIPGPEDAGVTIQVHDEFNFDLPVRQQIIQTGKLRSTRNLNFECVRELNAAMVQAGADFGIETPVNSEFIAFGQGWNAGTKISSVAV